MYKSIAAYAAALIAQPSRFTPAVLNGVMIWGIDTRGCQIYNNLTTAYKVSILGAIRAGHDALGGGNRAYNSVDKAVRHTISILYPDQDILTIDKEQAIKVLLTVARGS